MLLRIKDSLVGPELHNNTLGKKNKIKKVNFEGMSWKFSKHFINPKILVNEMKVNTTKFTPIDLKVRIPRNAWINISVLLSL